MMTNLLHGAHVANKLFSTIARLRLLLVMFLTLTVSAEVWGADVTVTWTASSGALGSNIESGTIKTGTFSWDYTRTLKSGSTYTGWSSDCIQLGKNGGVENITFTTSAIPGTIKKVSIECASYQGKHNVAITVGGKSYLSSTATSSWTTVSAQSGSGTSSGTIQISLTDGTRALYIKSISVTYEENSGSGGEIPEPDEPSEDACGWVEADISEITSTDNVVITMSKGDNVWALANNNGTGSAPAALLITIANGEITPAEDDFNYNGYSLDHYTWNISTNSDELTFYPKGSTSTWLYCTGTNNGVRVGTNANKTFQIAGNYLKHNGTSRYVGVYIDNPDWRCYTSTTSNISGQTLKFYKYVACGTTETTVSLTLESGLSCVKNGSATVKLNATELTSFIAATRDGFTCSGYWSAPSGGVKVLNADSTFAATSVLGYITDGKWTNEGDVTLTPHWECSNTMTLSVGTQSGGTYSLSKTSLETCDCTDDTRQVTITATPNSGYSVTDISYSGDGTATKVSGPTVNGENTEWVYQFNQGDNGNGTFTVTFTTIPTYTITLDAGSGTCDDESLTETSGGAGITLPTANPPATCATDDWEFAGWWTVSVAETTTSPGELLTAGSNYKPTEDCTLYAVYSKTETTQGGGGTENVSRSYTFSQYTAGTQYADGEEHELDDVLTLTTTQCHFTSELRIYSSDDHNGYVVSNQLPGRIISIDFNAGNKVDVIDVYGSTNGTTWTQVGQVSVTSTSYKDYSLDFGATNYTYFKLDVAGSNQVRLTSITITWESTTSGGGSTITTTYNSNPTCLVPVWNGADIDKTELTVNCGERSSMDGAAKITFSKDKIFGFSNPITIEASEGFLVSTSRTPNENYQQSVSQSPLVGTEYPNTFNGKFVYVRAEAPAQSDTDLSGTITIKNNKGETLQTFSVTAYVTCTGYTLTLIDRGVSTLQPETYFAGQTIDEAPAGPTGVCTDPIHYVFDGWAETTVTNGSTGYTPVSFPYTVTGNTKFYAVYRYTGDGGEPSNDFIKVTSAKDDWTGDYVIVNEDAEKAIGNAYQNTNTLKAHDVTISDNKVVSPSNDVIWQIRKNGEYYTMYNTTAAKYAYIEKADAKGAGLSTTAQNMQIIFNDGTAKVSGVDVYRCFYYYGTYTEWRTYATGNYNTGALYCRSLETYLYTTSPVCGPYVEITSDKDIYVTGGNAGGTHDLVVAQQKVAYQATRLKKDNETGNLPSIQVRPANITYDATKTKNVTITFDEDSVRTLQSDDTYTISGTMTISYRPEANNVTDDIQVVLNANYNPSADVSQASFTIHARSLPSEFVIVAKQGDKWYALNGDMSNGSSANPANGQITLDDNENPTKATYAPCNTIYTFDGLPNTGDRTRVRFQGTEGAWLWAASGTNVGIQNKTLAEVPAGDNKPYNWKLETEDNITYKFHNDNSSRLLGLSDEKFGMYASGVQDIRILPYVEKCLYNYAPSNLKVSVLKGSYVTLTWDAVQGATKYQYSTDATNWTDAGAEPTVTIKGLSDATLYTYYVRAYHADAGVSQECIDYSEITFTTADCDDVPTDITYTADLNSITVSWTASAATATVKLYSDEAGSTTIQTLTDETSPCKFTTDLEKNTTYYVQIFSSGDCASQIVKVKTEDVKVEIVEWMTDGIKVDINTDETVGVTLENEVSYGSGTGSEATELFFSKYYEATTNVKLVAIYNGTKNIIDLTDYQIHYGKDSWENQYITLKDFGETKGQIQQGEEIILYSKTDGNTSDESIMSCVHEDYPDGKWVQVTQKNNDGGGHLSFAGDKTIVLKKAGTIIDVIGALTSSGLPTNEEVTQPTWGDNKGWTCATGLSIANDTEIGISTNRCLLIRNNTVTSGENAVTSNIDDFVTLCSEWKGAQVPDNNVDNGVAASCENFAYVGTFDYSDYYTQFEQSGDPQVFEKGQRNSDGTVTVSIPELYKQSCRNIRITLKDAGGNVISNREYKVPIMITSTQGTDGQTFIDLQQNLAMIETDGDGNVVATHPLSLKDVREICKTCDVVIRNNATLMKMADDAANDHPQVRDIYIYENSTLIVPAGTNFTANSISLRRNGDDVASLSVYPDALKLPESNATPIALNLRVDAQNWHWFALPYDCNISEVTWVDGSRAQYNVDWFLMTYDGESRSKEQSHYENHWKQYFGTTIEAGKGYIVGITGDINNAEHTFELRFPIAKEVLTDENKDKTVDVRAWGVEDDIRPNKKGWNLVGNPYLAYYQKDNVNSFGGLRLGELIGPDPQTGHWTQTGNLPYVVVPVEGGWVSYEQVLVSETDLLPFTAYFVQVGNEETHTSEQDLKIAFDHTKLQLSATPMPASLIRRAPSEIDEVEEPVIVGVSLTNTKGESDKTSLVIDDRFTDKYEMNADFFKWFGDYYKYYTKPVLYTVGADQGKRAFNAISEDLATQPISLGMYAAQAGNYTFTLDRRSDLSKVQEVWLYDATQDIHINLLQESYTFHTAKTESVGRFFLSVKMAPKVTTDTENLTSGSIWATTHNKTITINGLLSNSNVWVYDATGKLLHADHTLYYQHSYSVPQSGTYFVRVQNTMQTQTIKVVVE